MRSIRRRLRTRYPPTHQLEYLEAEPDDAVHEFDGDVGPHWSRPMPSVGPCEGLEPGPTKVRRFESSALSAGASLSRDQAGGLNTSKSPGTEWASVQGWNREHSRPTKRIHKKPLELKYASA